MPIAQAAPSAIASLTPFWQTIKDFQGIIGAIVGFAFSGLLMLFITKLVSSKGKILFIATRRVLEYQSEIPDTGKNRLESIEGTIAVRLTIDYDLFNSSNEIRTLRDFKLTLGRWRHRKYYAPLYVLSKAAVQVRNVKLLPKDTMILVFDVRFEGELLDEIKKNNPEIALFYWNERNQRKQVIVGRIRD